ncbi:MAG: hypothetical protein VX112_04015 [Pseudomonadota bacterium]|nr:hypothetical protein [Pseudomonadota bacterium]
MTINNTLQIADRSFIELCQKLTEMTPDEINAVPSPDRDDIENPPFAELCQNPLVIYALLQNLGVVAKISEQGLNARIESGPDQGKSVVYALMSHPVGLELLHLCPQLVRLISTETFNFVLGKTETTDLVETPLGSVENNHINSISPNHGFSAAYWLTSYERGLQLLEKHTHLAQKLTYEGISTVCKNPYHYNLSGCWHLFYSERGKEILNTNPHVMHCFTSEAFNTVRPNTPGHPSLAPVHLFAYDKNAEDLFLNNPFLINLIGQDHLNNPIPGKSQTLLHLLFEKEDLHYQLNWCQEFISRIDSSAFNRIVGQQDGMPSSPVSWLCSTETGRETLANCPNLSAKIREEGFNHIHYVGIEEDGMAACYFLAQSEAGLQVFAQRPELVNLINSRGWNSAAEQGDLERISFRVWVRDHLSRNRQLARTDGAQLLFDHLEITYPNTNVHRVDSDLSDSGDDHDSSYRQNTSNSPHVRFFGLQRQNNSHIVPQ